MKKYLNNLNGFETNEDKKKMQNLSLHLLIIGHKYLWKIKNKIIQKKLYSNIHK